MSWVIIGGLITSTLLARLVTPVMYKLIPPAIAASAGERWYSRSPRGPGTNAGCPPGGLTRELDESRIPGFRHGQSR